MNKLMHQDWYDNKKIKEANLLYERLSNLATNRKTILEQETSTISPQITTDKSKDADRVMSSPQVQSTLASETSKYFGIDSGRSEGKEFNKTLSDFYASFLKDSAVSKDKNRPEASANSVDLAKKVIEGYTKYVKGEFGQLGKEFGSLSRAKASLDVVGKGIKRKLSSLFENVEKEDKKLLKEFIQALGAGLAAFIAAIIEIFTSIAGFIKALGFVGVAVSAFGWFVYNVMSSPKAKDAAEKGAVALDHLMGTAEKSTEAAEATAGGAKVATQALELKAIEKIACRTARKWIPGMTVQQGEYLKHAVGDQPDKVFVSEVKEVDDNGTDWNPGRTFECPK